MKRELQLEPNQRIYSVLTVNDQNVPSTWIEDIRNCSARRNVKAIRIRDAFAREGPVSTHPDSTHPLTSPGA